MRSSTRVGRCCEARCRELRRAADDRLRSRARRDRRTDLPIHATCRSAARRRRRRRAESRARAAERTRCPLPGTLAMIATNARIEIADQQRVDARRRCCRSRCARATSAASGCRRSRCRRESTMTTCVAAESVHVPPATAVGPLWLSTRRLNVRCVESLQLELAIDACRSRCRRASDCRRAPRSFRCVAP